MIDFHTHLLPGLDDGARDVDMARRLLTTYQKGDIIAATPHYYPDQEPIENFLIRREKALQSIKDSEITILPGAEVHLSPDLVKMEGIERLCIGNSGCILLELPYETVPMWIEPFLFSLIAEKKLIPVLAHVERYFPSYNDFKELEKLLEMDLYAQVNAASLKTRKKTVLSLLKRNMIHVLGSDCHNMSSRPNCMAEVYTELRKLCGSSCVKQLEENASLLLHGKKPAKQTILQKKGLFSFRKR